MVIVIHKSGRSWDDSACDDNLDVKKNAAARGTIQFAMVIVIHKMSRSCDDSACDGKIDVETQQLVGRFNSRCLS